MSYIFGSGYRTARGSLNLKLYSTTTRGECSRLGRNIVNARGKPKT